MDCLGKLPDDRHLVGGISRFQVEVNEAVLPIPGVLRRRRGYRLAIRARSEAVCSLRVCHVYAKETKQATHELHSPVCQQNKRWRKKADKSGGTLK